MALRLTLMDLPAIGAQIQKMQDGLNSLHVGGAEEARILQTIATDAEQVAAFVRRYVEPAGEPAAVAVVVEEPTVDE